MKEDAVTLAKKHYQKLVEVQKEKEELEKKVKTKTKIIRKMKKRMRSDPTKIGEMRVNWANYSKALQHVVQVVLLENSKWGKLALASPSEAEKMLKLTRRRFEEAFQVLPYAEGYIEKGDLQGLFKYFQRELDATKNVPEVMKQVLDHADTIFGIYRRHLEKKPELRMNPRRQDTIKYVDWYKRHGYLGALVDEAQAQVRAYKEVFFVPAQNVVKAVKLFQEIYVPAYQRKLERQIAEQKQRNLEAREIEETLAKKEKLHPPRPSRTGETIAEIDELLLTRRKGDQGPKPREPSLHELKIKILKKMLEQLE